MTQRKYLRTPFAQWRTWWNGLSIAQQDRVAMLTPLAAVLLFLAVILTAFWYLRAEEINSESEAVQRDLEYAQLRLSGRLLERQEEIMQLARKLSHTNSTLSDFLIQAASLVNQHPELQALTWIDAQQSVLATFTTASAADIPLWSTGEFLPAGPTLQNYQTAQQRLRPFYANVAHSINSSTALELHIPIIANMQFAGVILVEYSLNNLLRHTLPAEVLVRNSIVLLDKNGRLIAGKPLTKKVESSAFRPWTQNALVFQAPLEALNNTVLVRAQAYQTSLGIVGSGFFWLVGTLSLMTAWMLVANWRHTRRRMRAQQALTAETNFRRAMENSILTGMRALDLQGRITYVNAAFCQMTGWSEVELIGQTAPFSFWPENDHPLLFERLKSELSGNATPAGFKIRAKRKNNTTFDARLYVSPLIDAHGQQTGWMTSMTDITEPSRIQEQLSASYQRFTIVLEALDASVSVTPLGRSELLFANKLYRLWFGAQAQGHLQLLAQAGATQSNNAQSANASDDEVDTLMGLPTDALTSAKIKNSEIFIPELGKWLEVRSRYLNWVDGSLAQMVIATDITQRHQAEEQAARQAERAQSVSSLITMGEMASSVAHELGQPLAAISNYCNGMVSRIEAQKISPETLVSTLQKTAHQAQRAGQIIQRVLTFVKRSSPHYVASNAAEMVAEAMELASIELRKRNVRLIHYVAARLPALFVDPILIEQVLVNLIKNAAESIDASERPATRRNIELRVVPKQINGMAVVEFSVQDSGQGLTPEVLSQLFEAFFSTKSEGMGIGLNLCRTIIESHKGRLEAKNIYNGSDISGCQFSFWIPLVNSDTIAPATFSLLNQEVNDT